ncbi:methylenetetrahydrofolate reductase [Frondihabitans sucicola]|uniref:Methylenetetrahydrofolate reductase n=1 Tax=Frondihabitans sucicola TaxID=1268041 RepID=A0ABM8GLZ3_9MICO|nr:methylenetetrahydrofolate reductase [Frondihabitans sucicola]BDZ49420.1 methylenetetrahydrofolate reductase [Frondihabitans sucicola]
MTSVRAATADALRSAGYEILPFARTFENVLENVPRSTPLTVTASPPRGIGATVDLAVRLAAAGYDVAPHLAARMIADEHELSDVLARLAEAGVTSLFVVGGDGEPRGDYRDALPLLRAVRESAHDFTDIGIGGYPEGHALIPGSTLLQALREKAELANHVTTQICFDPAAIAAWAAELEREAITLPIRVGLPGAVRRQRLIRISAAIGLGDSARFLQKQKSLFWRFFLPGGYSPNRLITGLEPAVAGPSPVTAFHLFTFNELRATEAWRRELLDRYDS